MNLFSRLLFVATPLVLVACGGTDEGATPEPSDGIRDLRVEIPAPDSAYVDFLGGEAVIQPGEERMICTHMRYDGEDLAFSNLETLQGKFGHHAVLLGAKEPLPAGTVEDCTNAEDMAKYDAYTIGDHELPPGRGLFMPKGKAMVLQSHYVNSGLVPIRVRDFVRAQRMPVEDVEVWAALYVTNLLNFTVPAHQEATVTFDCTVEKDVNLLFVGGHMHEWGRKFNLQYGDTVDSLQTIYTVDSWIPDFRDNPPVTLMEGNPMPIKTGALLRTSCTWANDGMTDISFPKEMCTSFGYAEGTKEPVVCAVDHVP
jgi:hypothetical protein